MPKKLTIQNLSVETTRRCNMRCEHCLRKNAQDVDMPETHLRELLSQTSHIDTVTFTGGEPSLALNVIRTFYRLADEYGIPVGAFYIVTNGVANQLALATLCLELYDRSYDKEVCGVALSVDDFHDSARQTNIVRALKFYRDDKEIYYDARNGMTLPRTYHGDKWVVRTGRAAENNLGEPRDENATQKNFILERDVDDDIIVEELYLSANGHLYADGDLDYETMDADRTVAAKDAVETFDRMLIAQET